MSAWRISETAFVETTRKPKTGLKHENVTLSDIYSDVETTRKPKTGLKQKPHATNTTGTERMTETETVAHEQVARRDRN